MLETIKIKNFQSHADTKIKLHKNINVITGSSDAGKSSIYRAINWLRLNRPRGSAFVKNGSKGDTEVSMTFDGITVSKTKSKSKNKYKLDKEEFNVVGTDVPKEVTQFLNTDEVSMQGQHDRYFLLQDTPGEVAKKLNKVAGFEIIDSVMSAVKSAISKNTSDTKYNNDNITGLEESIAKFEHLDSVELQLNELQSGIEELSEKQTLSNNLESTLTTIQETDDTLDSIKEWLSIETIITPILKSVQTFGGKQEELYTLDELTNEITSVKIAIRKLSDKAEYTEDVEGIHSLIKKHKSQCEASDGVNAVLTNIFYCTAKINSADQVIEEATEELNELLVNEKICPMCGVKLTDNRIEHIKEL